MTMPGSMPPGAYPAGPPGTRVANPSTPMKVPAVRSTRAYLLVAVVLAAAAFLVVLSMSAKRAGTYVLVAERTVPARTKLTKDMFAVKAVEKSTIVEGAYTSSNKEKLAKQDYVGLYSRYALAKGSQLTKDAAGDNAELGQELTDNERLASFKATIADSVSGTLRVGDHVDVYGVLQNGDRTVSFLLASDVPVVGIAPPEEALNSAAQRQSGDSGSGSSSSAPRDKYLPADPLPGVYTFVLSSDMLPRMLAIQSAGELTLAYRAPGAANAQAEPIDATQAVCTAPPGQPEPVLSPALVTFCQG